MPKKFIIANWKMAPETLAEGQDILRAADEFLESLQERAELSIIICPPFVFLEEISKILTTGHLEHMAELGAQDIASQDEGALTGEISGPQLSRLNVRYVIVGHSERRIKLGETDAEVNAKLKAVLRNNLTPIVCIGERSREGDWHTELSAQIAGTFADLTADELENCFVAYEPVWAISSNQGAQPDTPESAAQAVAVLKESFTRTWPASVDIPFVYGGSVTPENASLFLARQEFMGVLVGGASVRKEDFTRILSAATSLP